MEGGTTVTTAESSRSDEGVRERALTSELSEREGTSVTLRGWVHARRDLGGVQFLLLRDRAGVAQCVLHGHELPLQESCVEVRGTVVASTKAPGGFELDASELTVLSEATAPPPVEISKEAVGGTNPETLLSYRHVTVRGAEARAPLAVTAELVKAFRSFLDARAFTEIFTPKIVAAGAEGGASLFEVDYFGKRAYLAQSPQLYKQIMIPVFERVFEVAPVFRAEASHTNRHLSEYLSLDVEFAFVRDEHDVMDLQEALVFHMMEHVCEACADELALLGAQAPATDVAAPRVPLLEARRLVEERYGHASGGKDLDPEAERLMGRWAREEHGSDFVFITDYPQEARPFYTQPAGNGLTRGCDLLFRGTEITSGGQRAHQHDVLLAELRKRKVEPEGFADYLEVFKHGMPPHGGFAIGAERIVSLLLGIPNVRFARAFPRDGGRLRP